MIQIQLLGIGAVKIVSNERTIYIDAFNSFNEVPPVKENDLLLFTHNDSDHFLCDKLKGNISNNNIVIGPPSITYPIFESKFINPNNLIIYYPVNYYEPQQYEDKETIIKVFNTDHFIGWHNVHISFLIEIENKKIYITGDSYIRKENEQALQNIDCIIASLMNESIASGKIDKQYGKYYHVWELIELKEKLKPNTIIGNHMINCGWTINPADLREIIERERILDVIIPVSSEEVVII